LIERKENGYSRPEWSEVFAVHKETKTYLAQYERFELRDGLLHRRRESEDGKQVRWQLVLPETFRDKVLDDLHG